VRRQLRPSLAAQREAMDNDCDQFVFVDGIEHRWVDELAGSNILFVLADGTLVTPERSGAILPGLTRASVLTLALDAGHRVEERQVDFDEWRDGARTGCIAEVFACGTAAVSAPVGTLKWPGGEGASGPSPRRAQPAARPAVAESSARMVARRVL